MKYEDIKDFSQRCEEHPDHQTGMISERMIQQRLNEEIDELRAYIETKQEQGEPVAWMYDWTSDEGEFIQDWTTSMAETLRDTGKTIITNVRPLYSAPQVIHKPLQHFGEIPMAWCRWSEHLGKWMYTHRQPTEELAWIPLYDHPLQKPMAIQMDVIVGNLVREGINKHRARELAEHFIKHTAPQPKQEQGEPVAWAMLHDNGAFIDAICPEEHAKGEGEYTHPLYTTPQRKPLTDEQIQEVMTKAVQAKEVSWVGYKENEFGRYTIPVLSPYHFQIVRAIEAAHGIKENI